LELLEDPFVPVCAGFVIANKKARNKENMCLKIEKWVNRRSRTEVRCSMKAGEEALLAPWEERGRRSWSPVNPSQDIHLQPLSTSTVTKIEAPNPLITK